jgi:hypothetical protein
MAQMTSLLNVVNSVQKDALIVGYPKLKPTLQLRESQHCKSLRDDRTYYADTPSNKMGHIANACYRKRYTIC